ncbi:hypothetical protein BJ742DRAFT_737849 [Cladochytrium replicatum]|nr:hypothetical protein BJ742DRAFT_737849 [Cladochytrium replicatum]
MDGDRTLMRAPQAQPVDNYSTSQNLNYYSPNNNTNATDYSQHQETIANLRIPRDVWSRTALIWTSAMFVIVGAVEGIILKLYRDQYKTISLCTGCYESPNVVLIADALTTYHSLVICALFFQLLLSFDAVLNSSLMQLIATAVFNIALFGYTVTQWSQASSVLNPKEVAATIAKNATFVYHNTLYFEYAQIAIMGIFAIGWCFISFKLRRVFGWSVFKELGADFAVRRRLTYYYVYMMLLKLDVFFFLGFVAQYLFLVLPIKDKNDTVFYINAAVSFSAVIILLLVAYFAVRRESNWLMALLLLGLAGAMGYLVTKLVEIFVSPSFYVSTKNSMTLFEVLTILMCLATFVVAILNFRNFGKGLIEQIKTRGNTKGHVQLDDMRPYNPRDPEANKNKNNNRY